MLRPRKYRISLLLCGASRFADCSACLVRYANERARVFEVADDHLGIQDRCRFSGAIKIELDAGILFYVLDRTGYRTPQEMLDAHRERMKKIMGNKKRPKTASF